MKIKSYATPTIFPEHEVELKSRMKKVLVEMDTYKSVDGQLGYLLNVVAIYILLDICNNQE